MVHRRSGTQIIRASSTPGLQRTTPLRGALRFEPEPATGGLKPYLHVGRELWAKVTRALFYDLVELGEERDVGGKAMFGVASGGEFYAMADASAVKEFA